MRTWSDDKKPSAASSEKKERQKQIGLSEWSRSVRLFRVLLRRQRAFIKINLKCDDLSLQLLLN